MKDLEEADVIVGIKIIRHNGGLMLNQSHYIKKILKRYNMFNKSPVSTPMDPCEKLYLIKEKLFLNCNTQRLLDP